MTDPADIKTDPLFVVDEREAKLPAWVRNLLDEARRRVRDAEELAETARLDTAPSDSPIILDVRGRNGAFQAVGLGRRPWVKCVLDWYPDGEPRRYIEFTAAYANDKATPIGAQIRGSDTLMISPEATNAAGVYLVER